MAVRDLKSVIYTDDFSRDYACRMDASVFGQNGGDAAPKVGGADYAASPKLPPMPTNLIPRHVVVSSGGNKRKVICLTPTASLFIGGETTINLPVLGTTAATYTVFESVAERYKTHLDPSG
jgi:hypothetical protein